jgi:hypothetical protein
MRLHNPSLKQVEEYSWIQEFEGRRIPVKVRVYYTPFDFSVGTGKATGKYNTSVFIGGKCYPFDDLDYEPSEPELKGLVSSQMSTWKDLGVIP